MKRYLSHSSLIPLDEDDRLLRLAQYDIEDVVFDPVFTTIAEMVAEVFAAPAAFVNFVDKDKVFFKANIGNFPIDQVCRENSLCSFAILEDEPTIIYDTFHYSDLRKNPYISCEGGIRFYAAAPIKTEDGYNIGTVCVIDRTPRNQVTGVQQSMLKKFATLAFEKLESKKMKRQVAKIADDHMRHIVHDLLNPLTSVILSAQLIQKKAEPNDIFYNLSSSIFESAKALENNISSLLKESSYEKDNGELSVELIKTEELINDLSKKFRHILTNKNQMLKINTSSIMELYADKQKLNDILINYLSNASKYSPENSNIYLNCTESHNSVRFSVRDEGQGISLMEINKLFKKFSRLSSVPTGNEKSHGFGLYTVKVLSDLQNGKVWAESEGKGKGSTFFLELPKYE